MPDELTQGKQPHNIPTVRLPQTVATGAMKYPEEDQVWMMVHISNPCGQWEFYFTPEEAVAFGDGFAARARAVLMAQADAEGPKLIVASAVPRTNGRRH